MCFVLQCQGEFTDDFHACPIPARQSQHAVPTPYGGGLHSWKGEQEVEAAALG